MQDYLKMIYSQTREDHTTSTVSMAEALDVKPAFVTYMLQKMLAYPWEKIHAEAEVLEHAISPYFEARIAQMLNDPAFDPHGDPIPNRELSLVDERRLVPLGRLQPGQKGTVSMIKNQDAGMLVFLGETGIHPDTSIEVIQHNPMDGSMQVKISGQDQVFGKTTVETILVEMGAGDLTLLP